MLNAMGTRIPVKPARTEAVRFRGSRRSDVGVLIPASKMRSRSPTYPRYERNGKYTCGRRGAGGGRKGEHHKMPSVSGPRMSVLVRSALRCLITGSRARKVAVRTRWGSLGAVYDIMHCGLQNSWVRGKLRVLQTVQISEPGCGQEKTAF